MWSMVDRLSMPAVSRTVPESRKTFQRPVRVMICPTRWCRSGCPPSAGWRADRRWSGCSRAPPGSTGRGSQRPASRSRRRRWRRSPATSCGFAAPAAGAAARGAATRRARGARRAPGSSRATAPSPSPPRRSWSRRTTPDHRQRGGGRDQQRSPAVQPHPAADGHPVQVALQQQQAGHGQRDANVEAPAPAEPRGVDDDAAHQRSADGGDRHHHTDVAAVRPRSRGGVIEAMIDWASASGRRRRCPARRALRSASARPAPHRR